MRRRTLFSWNGHRHKRSNFNMFADEDHVKYILGVFRPFYEKFDFIEALGQQMVRQTNFLDMKYGHRNSALEDLSRVGVYRTTDVFGMPTAEGAFSFVVSGVKYIATKNNEIASGLIFPVGGGAEKYIANVLKYLSDKDKHNLVGVRSFIEAIDGARGSPEKIAKLPSIQEKIANLPDFLYVEVRDPLGDIMEDSFQSKYDLTRPAKEVLEKRALNNKGVPRILKMLRVLDGSLPVRGCRSARSVS